LLTNAQAVRSYQDAVDAIRDDALDVKDSRVLLATLAKEMETRA